MEEMTEKFEFKTIEASQGEEAARIEAVCFLPNEACPGEAMIERAAKVPECFLIAVDRETGRIAGFLNGIATDEEAFRDEFFTDVSLHDPDGANIMLLGLDVLPEYRRQGLATELMERYALREKARGRKRLVLTCLERLVPMYRKMGYTDLGLSASTWGQEAWHEMQMLL